MSREGMDGRKERVREKERERERGDEKIKRLDKRNYEIRENTEGEKKELEGETEQRKHPRKKRRERRNNI